MKVFFTKLIKTLVVLVLLGLLFFAVWILWGKSFVVNRLQEKQLEELSDTYNATWSYSDQAMSDVFLSANSIKDSEAKYHSLWFLNTLKAEQDDVVVAVFKK